MTAIWLSLSVSVLHGLSSTPELTMRIALALTCLTLTTTSCADPLAPQDTMVVSVGSNLPIGSAVTVLPVSEDTHVRRNQADNNYGSNLHAWVRGHDGKRRSFLRWSDTDLATAVGTDSVISATVMLTADTAFTWGSDGRYVGIYRMTQGWAETGATWHCAVDTDLSNSQPDCEGENVWVQGDPANARPWVGTVTDSALVTNGLMGDTILFDVTADVAAFLSGAQPNYGWVVTKVNESENGRFQFSSREGVAPPTLTLVVASSGQDTLPMPPVPRQLAVPDPILTMASPFDSMETIYRNVVAVRFAEEVSLAQFNAFLAEFEGIVIGGTGIDFLIQIPDIGPTFAPLDTLLTTMAENTIVVYARYVSRLTRIEISSRFPNDGNMRRRADWFNALNGDYVWSRLATRLPLAWSCENGLYDTTRVRIAMNDFVFDANANFSRSVVTIVPRAAVYGDTLLSANDTEDRRGHGVGVSSILGATGDDGTGIAGAIWGANLTLFESGRLDTHGNLHTAYNVVDQFGFRMLESVDSGVRIFASAFLMGDAARPDHVHLIRASIEAFLANPNNLYLQAHDNDGSGLLTQSAVLTDTTKTATEIALAQLMSTALADQIILVTGFNDQGLIPTFAQYWQGATSIAGPAERIMMLNHGRQPLGTDSLPVRNGQSFAMPFVAGVAAQLMSMDPTLTGAEVKDYIIRGAREMRRDSTGTLVVPTPLANLTNGPLHRLDAYGSLSLLSRERPDTPVCGQEVVVNSTQLLVESRPAVTVPGAKMLFGVSMAQGGRRFALSDFDFNTFTSRVLQFDHNGQSLAAPLTGLLERRFLERDTVDITFQINTGPNGVDNALFTSVNGSTPINLARTTGTAQHETQLDFVDFDPTGRFAVLNWFTEDEAETEQISKLEVVPSLGGAPLLTFIEHVADLVTGDDCEECPSPSAANVGWTLDGQRVVVSDLHVTSSSPGGQIVDFVSRINTARVNEPQSQGQSTTLTLGDSIVVDDWWVLHPTFTPDGVLLVTRETTLADVNAGCRRTTRLLDGLNPAPLSVATKPATECELDADGVPVRVYNNVGSDALENVRALKSHRHLSRSAWLLRYIQRSRGFYNLRHLGT